MLITAITAMADYAGCNCYNFKKAALLKHNYLFKESTSSLYQKHTLILVLQRMMSTCEYLDLI